MSVVVSNSKLNTFQRCQKRYEYKYIRGLEPRKKSIQLERGSWMHALLEEYYASRSWKKKHKELTREFYKLFEEEREDLGDMDKDCLRLMRSYLRTYPDDFDRYVVVDTELDETVTLPSGLELRVIIDLVLEDRTTGQLFAWDHKTRANFEAGDNMVLDPQLTRYFNALQIMGYKPLGGVGYNEVRTKAPTVPAVLKSGGLSRAMKIDTDVWTYMGEINRLGLDPTDYTEILQHIARNQHHRFFRRTLLPKDPPMIRQMMADVRRTANEMAAVERRGTFTRTFDKSCKWGCDFKDVCIAELHGANAGPLIKMNFTTRDQRKKRGGSR